MLLLDSEPEASQPPQRGMPLTGSERNATLSGSTQCLLLLSSSPSAMITQHFFRVQSRVAVVPKKTIEKPSALL